MSYKRPERILLRIVKKKKKFWLSFISPRDPARHWNRPAGLSPSNILRDPRRETRKILARHRKDGRDLGVVYNRDTNNPVLGDGRFTWGQFSLFLMRDGLEFDSVGIDEIN